VPGHPEFNGLTRAAQAGFISYTLDYEGYGTSTGPEDGKSVDAQRLLDDAGDLVRWIRKRHNVSKVDLIGSSVGSSIALGLGSTLSPVPHQWIGHIVLTADVYKQVTPFMAQAFFTPSFEAFLNSVPNGYMFAPPEAYGLVLVAADPAAQNYCFQNCPGLYAVGPTLTGFHLPVFAAQTGRAPMLQFWGSADMVTPLSDAQQLQAEYGGPHSLVVLNGGAHVPQWESVRDQFWDKTFSFLSPHPSHEADDDDE
jgi:alpha-beta hydrolase superfamily lysophospholipase